MSSPTKDRVRTPRGNEPSPPYVALVLPRQNGSELFMRSLAARPWWKVTTDEENCSNFSFIWSQKPFEWESFYARAPGAQRQLINRFRGNGAITVKDRLTVNMRKYMKAAKIKHPELQSFMPLSFVVTVAAENEHSKDNGLKADHELLALREAASAAKQRGESMWIVMPPPLNRGRGIKVFRTLKETESFLKQRRPSSTWVVQKYIENPLLIDGRKFDIRLLVLVTPDQRVFMYRDSYVRTASAAYDPTNTADKSIHLVNDAVQIQFETYGKYEDANKLSMAAFQGLLDAQPLPDGRILSVDNDLWPAMRESVAHVFGCALSQHFMPAPPNGAMFELFGIDFMVDVTGRVLLIEVNTGPALCRHGHVLEETLPRLVEETMQKAVDPLFPPPPDASPPPSLSRFEPVDLPPPPHVVARAAWNAVANAAASANRSPSSGAGSAGSSTRWPAASSAGPSTSAASSMRTPATSSSPTSSAASRASTVPGTIASELLAKSVRKRLSIQQQRGPPQFVPPPPQFTSPSHMEPSDDRERERRQNAIVAASALLGEPATSFTSSHFDFIPSAATPLPEQQPRRGCYGTAPSAPAPLPEEPHVAYRYSPARASAALDPQAISRAAHRLPLLSPSNKVSRRPPARVWAHVGEEHIAVPTNSHWIQRMRTRRDANEVTLVTLA